MTTTTGSSLRYIQLFVPFLKSYLIKKGKKIGLTKVKIRLDKIVSSRIIYINFRIIDEYFPSKVKLFSADAKESKYR